MRYLNLTINVSLFFLLFLLVACGGSEPAAVTSPADKQTTITPSELSPPQPVFQLVPLADLKLGHLEVAVSAINETFVVDVTTMPQQQFPESAYVASRRRWRADDVLVFLSGLKQPTARTVIGLTDEDICTANDKSPTWGIFGLGALGGTSCVISTWRLGARQHDSRLNERLARVVLHEVGHTLGLEHCPVLGCLMQDAQGTIRSVDNEKAFCPTCQEKLGAYLRADSRYAQWDLP